MKSSRKGVNVKFTGHTSSHSERVKLTNGQLRFRELLKRFYKAYGKHRHVGG